jgi:hypothetical protein
MYTRRLAWGLGQLGDQSPRGELVETHHAAGDLRSVAIAAMTQRLVAIAQMLHWKAEELVDLRLAIAEHGVRRAPGHRDELALSHPASLTVVVQDEPAPA